MPAGVQPLPVQTEPGVHTAVAGGEKGVLFGVAGLRHHADLQSVGQPFPADCLADPLIKSLFHSASSFPFRKYTVSSFTVLMARQIRSAVMSWNGTGQVLRGLMLPCGSLSQIKVFQLALGIAHGCIVVQQRGAGAFQLPVLQLTFLNGLQLGHDLI